MTLQTPAGPQTAKQGDVILFLEQNWAKEDEYPYAGSHRRKYQVTSRFYTTFPLNAQGKQDQLAKFDVTDEDGNVGYGVLTSDTTYVTGNSGDVISRHMLTQTWLK